MGVGDEVRSWEFVFDRERSGEGLLVVWEIDYWATSHYERR